MKKAFTSSHVKKLKSAVNDLKKSIDKLERLAHALNVEEAASARDRKPHFSFEVYYMLTFGTRSIFFGHLYVARLQRDR